MDQKLFTSKSFDFKPVGIRKNAKKWSIKSFIFLFVGIAVLFATCLASILQIVDYGSILKFHQKPPPGSNSGLNSDAKSFSDNKSEINISDSVSEVDFLESDPCFFDGIPDKYRPAVWGKYFMKLYHDYGSGVKLNNEKECKMLNWKADIERDINRSFIHPKYKELTKNSSKVQDLERLLINYGNSDPGVRYMQGMNLSAAFLLSYFDFDKASCYFNVLMKSIGLRKLYIESKAHCLQLVNLHEVLLKKHLPSLVQHIENLRDEFQFETNDYFNNIVYSIFIASKNFELSARIWDLFPTYDFDFEKIFPLFTAALVKANEDRMLKMDSGDEIFRCLVSLLDQTNPEDFIKALKDIQFTIDPNFKTHKHYGLNRLFLKAKKYVSK